MKPTCRHCKKGLFDINGYLHRVNEKGVDPIWECRPSCNSTLQPGENVLMAIQGEEQVKEISDVK